MVRMVRLAKGRTPAEEVGVSIPPSAFTTDPSHDGDGKTWEEAGYKLDSYEDDHTPYEMTDADKTRVSEAKAARAAKAAPVADEPKAEPAKAKKD